MCIRDRGADYVIFEQPQPPTPDLPTLENPTLDVYKRQGKSFLLQTIRNYATERGFVVVDADLSPELSLIHI